MNDQGASSKGALFALKGAGNMTGCFTENYSYNSAAKKTF